MAFCAWWCRCCASSSGGVASASRGGGKVGVGREGEGERLRLVKEDLECQPAVVYNRTLEENMHVVI